MTNSWFSSLKTRLKLMRMISTSVESQQTPDRLASKTLISRSAPAQSMVRLSGSLRTVRTALRGDLLAVASPSRMS